MEVSSVVNSAYSSYMKNKGKITSQVETTVEVGELSDAEKLENFKKEIWDEINSFSWNKSMNVSIQITDGAFKRMMEDSDFKDRMLDVIKRESIAAQPPGNVSLTWIDENGYKGFSYIDNNAGIIAFKGHSKHKNSFYVQRAKENNDVNEFWLKRQQKRQEQRELLNKEYDRTQYLNSVYKHKADVARLYEEKTIADLV